MDPNNRFWDIFEKHLAVNVAKTPDEYMLRPGETVTAHAHRVREKMQATGLAGCNINSPSFKATAKELGIKPTYKAMLSIAQSRENPRRRAKQRKALKNPSQTIGYKGGYIHISDLSGKEEIRYQGPDHVVHKARSLAGAKRALSKLMKAKKNPRGRNTDVFLKHQLRIARDTLKMHPAAVGVMGGMTIEEAKALLSRHGARAVRGTRKNPKQRNDAAATFIREARKEWNKATPEQRRLMVKLIKHKRRNTLAGERLHKRFPFKNPAGHPLTAPSKHVIIAAVDPDAHEVMFFDGTHIRADRRKARLYPSSLVAKQASRKLKRIRGVTYVIAPAHWTGRVIVEKLIGRKNPASRAEIARAAKRLQQFSGHQAKHLSRHRRPSTGVGYELGPISDITYIAKRDGEVARYHHPFAAKSRPSLVASSDGTSLEIVGGRFKVTARGIVDH